MANDFRGGASVIDGGLRKYMISVFNRMFTALCVTGSAALLFSSSPAMLRFMMSGASFLLFIGMLAMVFYITRKINDISVSVASGLFWAFSCVMGASLSPMFVVYTGASLANCFFMTAMFFGGMSLMGYTTKKDLTSVGSFMIVGLICLVVTSLVNSFFLKSGPLQLGLSVIALVIFAGLTAYDIQKIKQLYSSVDDADIVGKKAILGALTLYLDFVNMFVAMLRIFGSRR
jgi:FtsH-binding integral membrane protein